MAVDTADMLKPTVDSAVRTRERSTLHRYRPTAASSTTARTSSPRRPRPGHEMMEMCSIAKANNIGCYSGQFKQYEGLTVNASEAINSFGGSVLDKDGKPSLNTARGQGRPGEPGEGLRRREHPARKPSPTRKRKAAAPSRTATCCSTATGRTFTTSPLKDRRRSRTSSAWRPLPGKDGPGASSLGGHSAASACTRRTRPLRWTSSSSLSRKNQKFFATQGSLAPVLGDLYEDKELVAKLPYLPGAEDLHRERRSASGHAVLPGRYPGHPGKLLRSTEGREVGGAGSV